MEAKLKVDLNYKTHYSFGTLHSGFELFHHIYLENLTDEHYRNLNLSVQTTPNILLKGDCVVDSLLSGGFRFVSCDFVRLDVFALAQLDSLQNVSVCVKVSDESGELLQTAEFSCKLLPYFCFSGLGQAPETLSYFVTPEQEEIAALLPKGSFSDPLDFCTLLYENIKEKKITFSSQDYSGSISLPIRLPEKLLAERFANSLEFSLLFASCCERAGLVPIIAYCGKGKVYSGFYLGSRDMHLISQWDKTQRDFEELYLIDGNHLAYGSELSFDNSLYHSKKALEMTDERVFLLNVAKARKFHLRSLPNREFSNGAWRVLQQTEDEKSGRFDDFYSLLNRHSADSRIVSVLAGERLQVTGAKTAVPFSSDLDVNQNKILSKILSNDFTLLRAQSGSGVSTVFAHAAAQALKSNKKVLYVSEAGYHSDEFARILPDFFDPEFVFSSDKTEKPVVKSEFSGIFKEHETLFEDRIALKNSYDKMDSYYEKLEGGKKIVSTFQFAADRYHQLRDANDCIIFSPEQVGMLSDEMVQTWFSTVNDLTGAFSEIGEISTIPLSVVKQNEFSYEYKSKFIRQLEEILRCIESITLTRDQILPLFSSIGEIYGVSAFFAFQDLTRLFGEFQTVPESFFDEPERIEENFRKVTHLIQAKKENDSILETVLISFDDGIFHLDAGELSERYYQLQSDRSFKGISQKHSILKSIKRYLKPNCDVENIEYILSKLADYQKNHAFIEAEKESVFRMLSVLPTADGADWRTLQFAADLCFQIYSVFLANFSAEQLPGFVSDYRASSESIGIQEKLSELRQLSEEFVRFKENLEQTFANQIDFFYPQLSGRGSDYFALLYEKLSSVLACGDHLKTWCNWLTVKQTADRIGLKNITGAIENGKIRPDECKKSFLRAFFKAVCEYNFIVHPELVPDGFSFDDEMRACKELEEKVKQNSLNEINSILSVRRMDALCNLQEESVLPLKLFSSSPDVFFDVFPIVIASPRDAIRLFYERGCHFDLVLIESKATLPLSEFVSLLSLGKKVAFAGSFSYGLENVSPGFDLNGSAFDYLWEITDEKYSLSAVYDSTPGMTAAKRAFSQAMRSDSRVYSVPAPKFVQSCVWHTVPGSFHTEYPGANLAEAEFCVERILGFARTKQKETLSVIAGTLAQKKLILRLLSQRIRQDEELTKCFSDYGRFSILSMDETLVRADEVIFSVTYAPNRSLHSDRLPFSLMEISDCDPYKLFYHVLSCAKSSFTVVSSFTEDSFRYSETVLPCVSALHLLYQVVTTPPVNNSYSLTGLLDGANVVSSVKNELEKHGYRVESGVQFGRYYIDLAVRDEKGDFVLGIISDQTVTNQKAHISAIESANAAFYKKVGWNLYRLQSVRCFDSFDREMEKILSVLTCDSESNLELI